MDILTINMINTLNIMEIDIFDYIKARPRDNLELLEIQKNKNFGKRYHNFAMHCLKEIDGCLRTITLLEMLTGPMIGQSLIIIIIISRRLNDKLYVTFQIFTFQLFSVFSFICMFCRSLFVLLSFFFWSLFLLFFDLRILLAPLVSSNSSYITLFENLTDVIIGQNS
jgi:hypothetical protein